MRIIAIMNQKGGCGKTTTAINLGACLAYLGKKVLITDLDPKAHATLGLGICPDNRSEGICDLMLEEPCRPSDASSAIRRVSEHMHLLPSDIRLGMSESLILDRGPCEFLLAKALRRIAGRYDYIIIDCPPNIGILTFNALFYCTEIIIPIETGLFSLYGLAKQMEIIELARRRRAHKIPAYALATMFDTRTRIAHESLKELRAHMKNHTFRTIINTNVKLKEAAGYGRTIIDYDRSSRGFNDYLCLAREVMVLRKMKKERDQFDTTLPSVWPNEIRPERPAEDSYS